MRAYVCVALIALGSVSSACKSTVDDITPGGPDPECKTEYTTYTSPATGVLTLQGMFYSNESVILMTHDANSPSVQVAAGTPATDRTSFTFTNIPSGQHDYYLIVSCDQGRDQENETFTVR